jgi:soluble lytic murein transglycosylase-like protein
MTSPFLRRSVVALPFTFSVRALSLTARVPTRLEAIAAVAVITASSLLLGAFAYVKSASADPSPARGHTQAEIETFVEEAATRFTVPARWIRAIMRVESRGDVRARSPKGAIGLMQVMPSTYDELRARYSLGADLFDPHDNILAGSAYIRELLDRYGSPNFLAAYNAGPARFDRYLSARRALPAETLEYFEALAPIIDQERFRRHVNDTPTSFTGNDAPLFARRADGNQSGGSSSFVLQPNGASTARRIADLSALVPHSNGLFVRTAGGSDLQ